MTVSWMLARLKEETRTHHVDADAARLAPLSTPTSVAGYASYLSRIWGLEAVIEQALSSTAELPLVIDPRGWSRAHWILDDLVALGVELSRAAELPRCTAVAPLRSIAEALGWMYVMERNAPLHGIVRRHLARRMPGQMNVAGTYLATTEALAPQRLRVLGDALDEVARTASAGDRIVEIAHRAFGVQQRWLRLARGQTSGVRRTWHVE
jgi:heme oxygenase